MTIRDLAKIAGVSHSTVSRSLNDSPLISDSTKKRIRELAKKYHFELNASAQSLSTRKTGTIGIIFPELYEEYRNLQYLGLLLNNLRYSLEKNNLDSIITFPRNHYTHQSNIVRMIKRRKVDGLLMVIPEIEEHDWNFILESDIPFVLLHFKQKHRYSEDIDYLYTDHFKGGYFATEHLIKAGHTKILCLTDKHDFAEYEDRTAGYRRALSDYNIEVDEKRIFSGICTFEFGYNVVRENREVLKDTDAIFAQADLMALGVIEALRQEEYKVPQDIAVVGYDDIELGTFLKPTLTTIHQPREKHAVLAIERLVELINMTNVDARMQLTVEPKLIIRESCGTGKQQACSA
jgi:LacI family transcriptional regulator